MLGAQPLAPARESAGEHLLMSRHDRILHDPDARDRWRSRTPGGLAAALAGDLCPTTLAPDRCYAAMVASMAQRWVRQWWPLPQDYDAPDARPASEEARAYQHTRGLGDGRIVGGPAG
eukprot:6208289-Pleurochrysis_carterae.AAC.1